jgi:hypothetical protein
MRDALPLPHVVAVLLSCWGVLGCGPLCPLVYPRYGVDEHVARAFSGEMPLWCGTFGLEVLDEERAVAPEVSAVVRCVERARTEGRAFTYRAEGYGIDSFIAHGVFGTADGRIASFWYDDVGDCNPESFSVKECVLPLHEKFDPWGCPIPDR